MSGITGIFDLYHYETHEVRRLVMVVGGMAWIDGQWRSLDGYTIWEDD